MTTFGASPSGTQQPHRGVLVLVLGILGIVLCFICGIVAWVMGRGDLQKMDANLMDPTGRGLTKAGMICGIVGTVLGFLWFLWVMFVVVLGVGAAAVGAAGAAGGTGGP